MQAGSTNISSSFISVNAAGPVIAVEAEEQHQYYGLEMEEE
jgi:hypothetical protein